MGLMMLISACTYSVKPKYKGDDYLIGEKLKSISSLTSSSGTELKHIAMFDKTVGKIYQFNLATGKMDRELSPSEPDGDHTVLYDQGGNYVIDFVEAYIGIYNRQGKLQAKPIELGGVPDSAAFQPNLGWLVVYDTHQNIGVIKLDKSGNVQDKWVGGPRFDDTGVNNPPSVTAGDVDESGRLIVGRTDGSIAVADLAENVREKPRHKWIAITFATDLVNIRWLAPVRGNPDLVLVRSREKISLVQISTKSVIDSVSFDSYYTQVKPSKIYDPHIILQSSSQIKVVYVENGKLYTSAPLRRQYSYILASRLSLTTDHWTMMESTDLDMSWRWDGDSWELDKPNLEKANRVLHRVMPSSLMSLEDTKVKDEGNTEFTDSHMFQLFSSSYGYAEFTNLNTGEVLPIAKFNRNNL
jgi:hypothetical protein